LIEVDALFALRFFFVVLVIGQTLILAKLVVELDELIQGLTITDCVREPVDDCGSRRFTCRLYLVQRLGNNSKLLEVAWILG
jgi:hypothetical protein